MQPARLKSLGLALVLFALVYAPAFLTVGWLRPSAQVSVSLIIGISVTVALCLIVALARRPPGLAEFGFAPPGWRYLGLAVVIGLPLALAAGWLGHRFPAPSPISTAAFPAWMLWLDFGLAAPIQEEVVFRGLVQSVLARTWETAPSGPRKPLSAAVLFTALLFGIVHLDSGPIVAVAALALGLIAGDLRARSGSLVPAVIVHALFNLPDLLWR